MVFGGSSTSSAGGFCAPAPTSETDGETFDNDADFDEYDDWDFNEIFNKVSKNIKTYVLQPIVVGAAAAFGMSVGYAMFDATASIFSRKSASASAR